MVFAHIVTAFIFLICISVFTGAFIQAPATSTTRRYDPSPWLTAQEQPARRVFRVASNGDNTCPPSNTQDSNSRRAFLGATPSLLLLLADPAHARGGLVQFPCTDPLGNTYCFLRVGETLLEAKDIWWTNPLFLTNEDAGLSSKGREQIHAVCQQQLRFNAPSVVRYSFAKSCADTAAILREDVQISQDRIVPEFFFLDPRAIGQWDTLPKSTTEPAVWALDVSESDYDGRGGRPPANEDGTPNETLGEQAIRLRQLFSACETQYSGDTVVLIFPDGTGPALLSCMIAGIPFNRVHELEYQPGELRSGVTRESTLQLLKERQSNPEQRQAYNEIIHRGKLELERLRSIDFIKEREIAATARAVKEAEENASRKARVEAQGQSKIKKQQSAIQKPKSESPDSSMLPLLGSIGALGAVGGFLSVVFKVEDGTATESVRDSAGASDMNQDGLLGNLDQTVDDLQLIDESPERTKSSMSAAGRSDTRDDSESGLASSPSTIPKAKISLSDHEDPYSDVKRFATAEKAMRDYLDADDGGSAWLRSISDIIGEEDEINTNETSDEADSNWQ